jgi:hypothetical protein
MLMRLTRPETARPVEWTTYPPRDLARTATRLSRDGPPAATFSNCRRALAVLWEISLHTFAAMGAEDAEERLPRFVPRRSSESFENLP